MIPSPRIFHIFDGGSQTYTFGTIIVRQRTDPASGCNTSRHLYRSEPSLCIPIDRASTSRHHTLQLKRQSFRLATTQEVTDILSLHWPWLTKASLATFMRGTDSRHGQVFRVQPQAQDKPLGLQAYLPRPSHNVNSTTCPMQAPGPILASQFPTHRFPEIRLRRLTPSSPG